MKTIKTNKGTVLPLLNLKGKDYLKVAHRLVWFREEHSDWSIQTFQNSGGIDFAVFRAEIRNSDGFIIATAHKREDMKHFQDYIEKAETGAIGRALALCGYGTQFEPELDEGDRLADSPISKPNPHAPSNMQPSDEEAGDTSSWGYIIPFGKFAKRTLEEVGPKDLTNYINYLEKQADKDGKEITGKVKEFIDNATSFIIAFENQDMDQMVFPK